MKIGRAPIETADEASGPRGPRIHAIDGLRGWAVALVFAVHFSGSFTAVHRATNFDLVGDFFSLNLTDQLLYWLFYSHYGVYIFFVISGFVISRSFAGARTLGDYAVFLGHRVLRIYPAFLISLAAAVLLSIRGSGPAAFDLKRLLANLVFLNGAFTLNVAPYNGVTWSLFFEFVYYLVFPIVFLVAARTARPERAAPAIGLALIVAVAALGYREWFLYLAFLAGTVAGLQPDGALRALAARCRDGWLLGAYVATTTAACLWLPLARYTPAGFDWRALFPVFVLVLSVVTALTIVRASYGTGFLHRALISAPFQMLGRISFSFFLIHTLVIGVVIEFTAPYFGGRLRSAAALAVLAFSSSCLLAALLYQIAEKPYYAFRRASQRAGGVRARTPNGLRS
ncbi:MAG TPA: acyltransferase [Casimicrobiaceae bacterium]|nr:acyltransferase [Casimicrobiaceae bacterium]